MGSRLVLVVCVSVTFLPSACRIYKSLNDKTELPITSFCSAAQQHNFRGFKNNGQVQGNCQMLNIKQVELKFTLGILDACTVRVLNLGPTSEAGWNGVSKAEEGNFLFEHFGELG